MSSSRSVSLQDGRSIGYIELGNPEGPPLFYFHGYPGSRYEAGYLAEAAALVGVRLLSFDRPGIGLSTYQQGRKIIGWPDDVAEVADKLHIGRFGVIGLSGGGPYALACVYKIPERITRCGVISGSPREGRIASALRAPIPWMTLPIMKRVLADRQNALSTVEQTGANWAPSDRDVLKRREIQAIIVDSITESFRQGVRGAAYDGMLNDWGFEPKDIRVAGISIWHGEADTEVKVGHIPKTYAGLKGAQVKIFPNEGHLSLIINRAQAILATIAEP